MEMHTAQMQGSESTQTAAIQLYREIAGPLGAAVLRPACCDIDRGKRIGFNIDEHVD